MKTRIYISLLIIVLTALSSCSDIADYRDNYRKVPLNKFLLSKEDTLSVLGYSDIDLDIIKRPRIRYFQLEITNLSSVQTITLYSFVPEAGSILEPTALTNIPFSLLPGETNINNKVEFRLNSSMVPLGKYKAKIYINESMTSFILVTADISN